MSLRIVIVGAGQVGYNLSKSLAKEDYAITVVDIDEKKCLKVKNAIDAKVVLGNGASQRILQQIDMTNIDYFLALTSLDEINLIASKTAKTLGAKKVIARLRSTEFSHKDAVLSPNHFEIDHVSYPEKAAQKEIEKLIRRTSAVEVISFNNDQITLLGIKLETSSPLVGRSVKNVKLANPFINHQTAVIYREDSSFVPHDDTIYAKDDVCYFICKTVDVDAVQKMTGKPTFKVRNVMILGSGKIGRLLGKSLQYDYNVKILEKNINKANKYAATLNNTLMLVGDGLDAEFLESENIYEMDCFISTTQNEKTNMLGSLIAKHQGVKQVIMHVSTTSYIKAIRGIGVDAVVSKNISAVNEVLKIIRSDEDKLSVSRFEEIDIEVVELKVKENSDFINRNLSIKDLPAQICLGAILRKDHIIIPNNQTQLRIDDELLFFTKSEDINIAEELF